MEIFGQICVFALSFFVIALSAVLHPHAVPCSSPPRLRLIFNTSQHILNFCLLICCVGTEQHVFAFSKSSREWRHYHGLIRGKKKESCFFKCWFQKCFLLHFLNPTVRVMATHKSTPQSNDEQAYHCLNVLRRCVVFVSHTKGCVMSCRHKYIYSYICKYIYLFSMHVKMDE